jgi:hypothetical protein
VPTVAGQVEEFTRRGVEEHKGNYNIWYGKYESIEGKRAYDRGKVGTNPETRCVVATDVGKTKGNTQPSALLCYLFAQGRCHHGPDCNFLHRIPDAAFDASLEHSRDCFGRQRHGTDAEGMGGVGNFMTNSRTLYIGNIKVGREKDNLEKRVREHFGILLSAHITLVHFQALALQHAAFATTREAQSGRHAACKRNRTVVNTMLSLQSGEWGELEVVKVFPNRAIGPNTNRPVDLSTLEHPYLT